ncbi:cyclic AMP-responsive element-binding protein 3-like protein 3-A [Panonychus citri]|uniref:cyclic AMP-responsive element-binding protein 3-like protein 3-A n=1 Tax=Panonychus citri TaxID=50023 RepID=UPI0023083672|nr:cyclic AMP-responsive element-binding protein 3-like protein 3-A [Panonychus citri]
MSCLDCPLEPYITDDCMIDKYIESIVSQTNDLPEFDPLLWSESGGDSDLIGRDYDEWPESSGSNENSNLSEPNHLSFTDIQESASPSPSKVSISGSSSTSPEEDGISEEVIEEYVDEEILLSNGHYSIESNGMFDDQTDCYIVNQSPAPRTFEIHNYCCVKYENSEDNDEDKSVESSPKVKQTSKGSKRRNVTDFRLTEEERKLLNKEGYTDFPSETKELTHQEEKILRKIRRKIRNKRSAQFSRLRKKQYVEELEKKYEDCTSENKLLKKEVDDLRRQNQSLTAKMKKILKDHTGHGQASFKTSLFVILLSFLFILMPNFRPESLEDSLTGSKQQQQIIRTGRHLLMTLGGHDLSSYNLNESENFNFTNALSI